MSEKRKVSRMAATIGVVLAATCGLALAQGWHGHGGGGRGGDGQLFLLARAAGVSKSTLASAFHGNTTLHNDFSTLRSAHQAVISCLVSAPSTSTCGSAITAYETAQTQLTKDKLAAWQGVFAAASESVKRQHRPGAVASLEDPGACSARAKAPDTERNFRRPD